MSGFLQGKLAEASLQDCAEALSALWLRAHDAASDSGLSCRTLIQQTVKQRICVLLQQQEAGRPDDSAYSAGRQRGQSSAAHAGGAGGAESQRQGTADPPVIAVSGSASTAQQEDARSGDRADLLAYGQLLHLLGRLQRWRPCEATLALARGVSFGFDALPQPVPPTATESMARTIHTLAAFVRADAHGAELNALHSVGASAAAELSEHADSVETLLMRAASEAQSSAHGGALARPLAEALSTQPNGPVAASHHAEAQHVGLLCEHLSRCVSALLCIPVASVELPWIALALHGPRALDARTQHAAIRWATSAEAARRLAGARGTRDAYAIALIAQAASGHAAREIASEEWLEGAARFVTLRAPELRMDALGFVARSVARAPEAALRRSGRLARAHASMSAALQRELMLRCACLRCGLCLSRVWRAACMPLARWHSL